MWRAGSIVSDRHRVSAAAVAALTVASAVVARGSTLRVVEIVIVGALCTGAALLPQPWSRRAAVGAAVGYVVAEATAGRIDNTPYLVLLASVAAVLLAGLSASALRDELDRRAAERDVLVARREREVELRGLDDRLSGERRRSPLRVELGRAHRRGSAVSLLVIAVDGGGSLDNVAAAIAENARVADVPFVGGSGEMFVVLPDTGAAEARMAGERLRLAVAGSDAGVTVSVGASSYPLDGADEAALLDAAAAALERARALGGNRTILATAAPGDPVHWAGRHPADDATT